MPWTPQRKPEEAAEEAALMEQQYRFFCELKTRCQPEESQRVEHLVMQARRYMMDSHSFLVALRRRGYDHALQEVRGERTIVEDETTADIGENLPMFPPSSHATADRPHAPWRPSASR
jgi:hypothetical protein